MIKNIIRYIEYLKKTHDLEITVHCNGKNFSTVMRYLAPYNIHYNPYCLYVKSCKMVWDTCIERQYKVYDKAKDGAFFGCCYTGVAEFVIPLVYKDEILGFISASGYKGDRNKMLHFAEKFDMDKRVLVRQFDRCLKEDVPDQKWVETLVMPLACMLILYYLQIPESTAGQTGDYLYGHALRYMDYHFAEKITLQDIADACHCSTSYISRLFTRNYGKPIQVYIRERRIEQAKHLLAQTDLPVNEIAFLTGFSDSNYFSNVFKEETGQRPGAYRKSVVADNRNEGQEKI